MTRTEWESFLDEKFVDKYAGQASDFQSWWRLKGLCPLDFDAATVNRKFQDWSRSKRRGKHCGILDRKRRKEFGPGRYHAATCAGLYLNKRFVKGWGGVNPDNP